MSDPKRWADSPVAIQAAVAEKYYSLRSIQAVGIQKVLEDNVAFRRSFALLLLGILLGVLGSLLSTILWKYLEGDIYPKLTGLVSEGFLDLAVVFAVLGGLSIILGAFNRMLAEHLAEDDVLGHLIEMVETDQKEAQSISSIVK